MIDIYLPIAQISVSLSSLIIIGLFSGLLSGIYGIGGGIVAVPLMIFVGIPGDVAIATSLLQIVGISFVNVVKNVINGGIDYKLGLKIALFSSIFSVFGSILFKLLHKTSAFYPVIYSLYLILIGVILSVMIWDILISLFLGKIKKKSSCEKIVLDKDWTRKIEEFEEFILSQNIDLEYTQNIKRVSVNSQRRTQLILSAYVGSIMGVLSGIMGIGGGFISMPSMVYIFKKSLKVASVTSSFIALLTTIPSCLIQLSSSSLIDPVIAMITCIFSIIAVKFGNLITKYVNEDLLKILFCIILICIGSKFYGKLINSSVSEYEISIF